MLIIADKRRDEAMFIIFFGKLLKKSEKNILNSSIFFNVLPVQLIIPGSKEFLISGQSECVDSKQLNKSRIKIKKCIKTQNSARQQFKMQQTSFSYKYTLSFLKNWSNCLRDTVGTWRKQQHQEISSRCRSDTPQLSRPPRGNAGRSCM